MAFALAAALHAGFQIAVTVLVYPVLATRGSEEWQVAHARHSRAIAPLVAVIYGALLVVGGWLVVDGPDLAGWLALATGVMAFALTAAAAAPTHGRLTDRDDALIARLLVADRWRCVCAVGCAALAAVAVGTA